MSLVMSACGRHRLIESEVAGAAAWFESQGKLLEAQRCGCAPSTTSRCWPRWVLVRASKKLQPDIDGGQPGAAHTLLDFFPKNYFCDRRVALSVPQLHGQYEGDTSQGDPGEHGFRCRHAGQSSLRFDDSTSASTNAFFLSARRRPTR